MFIACLIDKKCLYEKTASTDIIHGRSAAINCKRTEHKKAEYIRIIKVLSTAEENSGVYKRICAMKEKKTI